MNYENTCVATVPIGMFPSKKMMSAMVVFVHPEALKNKIVNYRLEFELLKQKSKERV